LLQKPHLKEPVVWCSSARSCLTAPPQLNYIVY